LVYPLAPHRRGHGPFGFHLSGGGLNSGEDHPGESRNSAFSLLSSQDNLSFQEGSHSFRGVPDTFHNPRGHLIFEMGEAPLYPHHKPLPLHPLPPSLHPTLPYYGGTVRCGPPRGSSDGLHPPASYPDRLHNGLGEIPSRQTLRCASLCAPFNTPCHLPLSSRVAESHQGPHCPSLPPCATASPLQVGFQALGGGENYKNRKQRLSSYSPQVPLGGEGVGASHSRGLLDNKKEEARHRRIAGHLRLHCIC